MIEKEYVKKSKENNRLKILIIALLLCLIGVLAFTGYTAWKGSNDQPRFLDDFSAKKGLLSTMTKDDIQKMMNQTVKDGYVNIYINSNPVFKNGDTPGNVYIQNIPANKYGYRVKIKLKNSTESVLETGYIAPGYNIEYQKLSKHLKKGEYEATAVFLCYKNEKDKLPIAESDVSITITVQN